MDAAMKKLVSARLQAHAAASHPDSEMLNAYAENQLLGRDRDDLLTHLAVCADCRDALYLAAPEADTQPVLTRAYRPPRLAVRWATLAASVVILGGVLLTDRGIFSTHSTSIESPQSPTDQVAELKSRPVEGVAKASVPAAVQTGVRARPPLKHMTARPQASMQFDQSGQVHLAAPQAASGTSQAYAARMTSADIEIPRASWNLSPNGDVQRSRDAGKTWQTIRVADMPFRAISVIGNDIWVGGNAGALYHSADSGQSWTRVNRLSADDVTHIEFSDPQNGLLNTANGQVWSTSDAGQSWKLK